MPRERQRSRKMRVNDGQVLLVDDDVITRNYIALQLQRGGLTPVCVSSPEDALGVLGNCLFSLAMIDLSFPQSDVASFELVRYLQLRQPGCGIIIITSDHRPETAISAIRMRVDDYLLKPVDVEDMLAAIRQQIGICDQRRPRRAHRSGGIVLSQCERKVLEMFYRGYSYKETAEILGVSLGTIQTHAKRIYRKMGVHSRAEATHEALNLNLIG